MTCDGERLCPPVVRPLSASQLCRPFDCSVILLPKHHLDVDRDAEGLVSAVGAVGSVGP